MGLDMVELDWIGYDRWNEMKSVKQELIGLDE